MLIMTSFERRLVESLAALMIRCQGRLDQNPYTVAEYKHALLLLGEVSETDPNEVNLEQLRNITQEQKHGYMISSEGPHRVTVEKDEHVGEYVIRLHNEHGYTSIGAVNGQEEAEAIYAILQGAIELDAGCSQLTFRSEDATTRSFWRGMRQAVAQLDMHKFKALFPEPIKTN